MPQKVKVSERAIVARISRALAKEGEALRRCRRDSRSYSTLGDYYVIDINRNFVTSTDIDLEKWAREMKVLQAWEEME